jgi:hypothetical protein
MQCIGRIYGFLQPGEDHIKLLDGWRGTVPAELKLQHRRRGVSFESLNLKNGQHFCTLFTPFSWKKVTDSWTAPWNPQTTDMNVCPKRPEFGQGNFVKRWRTLSLIKKNLLVSTL